MKKNILFFLFLASVNCFSQTSLPVDSVTGKISYTKIVKVDSVSKLELYSRAKMWFAKTFVSGKEVIQNADEVNFIIYGKGNVRATTKSFGSVVEQGIIKFSISIACKDGKYKYVITDFEHEAMPGDKLPSGGSLDTEAGLPWFKSQWDQVKRGADNEALLLAASIKKAMSTPITSNDW